MTADIFYDRSLRLWTLLWKDQNNDQVGEAEYYNSLTEVQYWAKKKQEGTTR